MSQNAVIRNYSVFIDSKRMGTMQTSDYNLEGGTELQIGDGEVIGASEGVMTGNLSATAIVPVANTKGVLDKIQDALETHKAIQLGVGRIGPSIHKVWAWCKSARYSTNTANGTLTGQFEFIFGKPDKA